jgi:hypothetical protein
MASYKCTDVMCSLTMDSDEEDPVLCPKCGTEMEEFFPEITACDVPPEQNVADASPLANAIAAKFTN